jgi:hypothetical protein
LCACCLYPTISSPTCLARYPKKKIEWKNVT